MTITEDIINKYKDIEDKFDSVITAIYYDCNNDTICKDVEKMLKKVKDIKNKYKKEFLERRYKDFLNFLKNELKSGEIINSVFLSGKGEHIRIKLEKREIKLLNENNIRKNSFYRDRNFNIEFLYDVFINNVYYDVVELNNKKFTHYKLSKYKKKIIYSGKESELEEYSNIYLNNNTIYHGKSSFLKNIKFSEKIYYKHLSIYDILNIHERNEMEINKKRLEQLINNLKNPKIEYKIKIGKDLIIGLKNNTIKTLFYCSEKKNKLFSTFNKDDLNTELIEIKKIDKTDYIYETLYRDFSGFIAESYY